MAKIKLLFLSCFIILSQTIFSQEKKAVSKTSNAPQTVKITGKAYLITRTLTGVQGAYSPDPPPTTYVNSDTVIISNRTITFINKADKKFTVKTDKKGFFTANLIPGEYVVHQPESPSGTAGQEWEQGIVELTISKTPKYYKIIFFDTDNSQNSIPQMSR